LSHNSQTYDSSLGQENQSFLGKEMTVSSISFVSLSRTPDLYAIYDGGNRYVQSMARGKLKREAALQRRCVRISWYFHPNLTFRITVMVGVIVIAFIVCWFPFALLFTVSHVHSSVDEFFEENVLEEWATWLSMEYSYFLAAL
jgi:hypothetical protein